MLLLTNSRLKSYRLCPRLHQYEYNLAVRPARPADALTFGTAFHAGMEDLRGDKPIRSVFLENEYENARVVALITGYAARWADDDKRYDTVHMELPFEEPLIHPVTGKEHPEFRLAGKIDRIVYDRQEDEWMVGEYKTSGEDITLGGPYWQRLTLDTQILLYAYAARRLGFDVSRTVYDVAAKPRQRPRKTEKPHEFGRRILEEIAADPTGYYARCVLTRFDHEIDSALCDAWDWADRIAQDRAQGWNPRNPDACHKWNRPCAYLGVCTGAETLESESFVKLDDPHPELRAA